MFQTLLMLSVCYKVIMNLLAGFLNSTLLAIAFMRPCLAATYYVWADEGNDGNTGLSWRQSIKSLNKAAAIAHPGDTVIIRKSAMPYRHLKIQRSGSPGHPIRFVGEKPTSPPIISGAIKAESWDFDVARGVWTRPEKIEPKMLTASGKALTRSSNREFADGDWTWQDGQLMLRSGAVNPTDEEIWVLRNGGGIAVGNYSWIEIIDIACWMGRGACISIKGGSHIRARRIHAKWNWRGVDITDGGNHNTIENCFFEENREGAYIRNGSSFNTVKDCKIYRNGREPLWRRGDRHAIGIGEKGPNRANVISNNDVAENGGRPNNVAVIAFRAPETTFSGNRIHHNYGSGLFVTTDSDSSVVSDNDIYDNGMSAVSAGVSGIAALSVRNSRNVRISGNRIIGNAVSAGDETTAAYRSPHGALDVSGHKGYDMSNLNIENNEIEGNVGGAPVFVSHLPYLKGLRIAPAQQAPSWLRRE